MTSSLHYQNAELVYRTGGQEGAPTIVLLHGGLGSMEDFAPLLPRLQQQFLGRWRSIRAGTAFPRADCR